MTARELKTTGVSYKDLTEDELSSLVEMALALENKIVSIAFFNTHISLLRFAVLARKAMV